MGLYLARHEEKGSTLTLLGTMKSSEVNNIGVNFFADKRFEEMGYSIWDLNEADFPDYQPGQNPKLQDAAIQAAQANPEHKIGFIASKPSVKDLCYNLIGLNVTTTLPWNLKVFSSIEQAYDWLGVES